MPVSLEHTNPPCKEGRGLDYKPVQDLRLVKQAAVTLYPSVYNPYSACSLDISNFLNGISSLSHSTVFLYFFALSIEEGFLISPCYIKMLHSIYQQIWKTQQQILDCKGQFSFQSQREEVPKNVQTPDYCAHFSC